MDRLRKVAAGLATGTIIFLWLCAIGSQSHAQPPIKFIIVHATDCTGETAKKGTICFEADANTIYVCEPSAGDCDTAGEWSGPVGDGVGTDSGMPADELNWTGPNLEPVQPADAVPPIGLAAGTNFDSLYAGYDDTGVECRAGRFRVPAEIDTAGTITFIAEWDSAAATSGDVLWEFRHAPIDDNEDWDAALTTEAATADETAGTVKLVTVTTWTETVSNAGWTAGDFVRFLLCRNPAGDDLVGDARLHNFVILIPRD